jgi:hypothetical protein
MTEYQSKINECKECDDLSNWEKGFFFGSDDSSPIEERVDNLSVGQKRIIDRVYNEKVLGDTEKKEITSGNIVATKGDFNKYTITIDGKEIKPTLNEKDTRIIVYWLAEAVADMKEALGGATEKVADDFPE